MTIGVRGAGCAPRTIPQNEQRVARVCAPRTIPLEKVSVPREIVGQRVTGKGPQDFTRAEPGIFC